MFYVYILRSLKDRRFYIGFTKNVKNRLEEHNSGKVCSTKNRKPFELVYFEAFKYEKDAKAQELFYKTGQGRRVLKGRLKSVIEDN